MIIESKIDSKKLYFHGSAEKITDKFDAPTFEHPFFVTQDLHYAMVFCSKEGSNTGKTDRDITTADIDERYVYVFSLNPSANFFDFRDNKSEEFKKLYDILPKELVDFCIENMADDVDFPSKGDFYLFCSDFVDNVLGVTVAYENYDEYQTTKVIDDEPYMSEEQFELAKKNAEDFKFDSNDYQTHRFMAKILKRLSKIGYVGFISQESDTDEISWKSVHTDYAVGIFDINGIEFGSVVPMKYKWLKDINPKYLENETDRTCDQKIRTFIDGYRKGLK